MELELDGHVAVVTGGASGIGLACARGLAREGCRVAVWDVSPEVKDAGEASLGVIVDVSVLTAVEAAVKETEAALGPISHLVHAAAVGSGKFGFPFSNLKPEDWPRVLNINVMGMVHVAHAMAPGMIARKAGTMVFVGSVAGQCPRQRSESRHGADAAESAGLAGLERSTGPGATSPLRGLGGREDTRSDAARPLAGRRGYRGHGGVSIFGTSRPGDWANH